MSVRVAISIAAPVEQVWSVMADVEHWQDWTPTIASVQRLDRGPFRVGSSARIKQPKLPPIVWTVSELVPLDHFTWSAASPGAATIAGHQLTPGPDGSVTVTLSIERTGPLAPLLDLVFGKLTREYVTTEAQCLKRTVEARTAAAAA
jgi:uncharacterized membrane protein